MRALLAALHRRTHSHGHDRGETPMGVILGLTVFALLVLSAGPTLLALTSQSATSSNDRRADKALAVLTDSMRREPWVNLAVAGPVVDTVDLAGHPTKVTTWVQADGPGDRRRLITKAIAPYDSPVSCSAALTPAQLPKECVVRTAIVAAAATDVRPPTSPNVTVRAAGTATTAGATITTGTKVFDVTVSEPMRVAVVARTSADVTLDLVSADVARATVAMRTSAGGGTWRFGNAVVCPAWSRGGVSTAQVRLPAFATMADLLVLTTPAPGACGQTATFPTRTPLPLTNGWVNYATGYSPAEYAKTNADVVVLSGLIRGGTTTAGAVVAQLPAGYRPANRLIFTQATSGVTTSRVDVTPTGEVTLVSGPDTAAGWLSLDGIEFVAAGSTKMTFTRLVFTNGWSNYGGGFEAVAAARDAYGRVHLRGLARAGTIGDNTVVATLPTTLRPDLYQHMPTSSGPGFSSMGVSAGGVLAKAETSAWLSTQALFYAADAPGTWTNPALQNGWAKYPSADFPTLQYRKAPDGVVTVRGLVYAGTTTSGTVIATLPPGYRPTATQVYAVGSTGQYGRIDVQADGDVVVREGVTNGWLATEVTFVAEQ